VCGIFLQIVREISFFLNWAKISGMAHDDVIAFYCCRRHHIATKAPLLTFVKSQEMLLASVNNSHTNCTTKRHDSNIAFTTVQTAGSLTGNSCAAETKMNCTSSTGMSERRYQETLD
jgi:hypothetical protein